MTAANASPRVAKRRGPKPIFGHAMTPAERKRRQRAKTPPRVKVPLTPAIAAELYIALERLEAPPELLSIIGSYGDTLDDEEVLRLLKDWNATGKVIHRVYEV